MRRFQDDTAIITGGARGIGFAAASRLAAEGARVAIIDLDDRAAAESAHKISTQYDTKTIGVGADVQNHDDVKHSVAKITAELGEATILVNNAGIIRDNLLYKMSEQDWDSVMGVHLKGLFLMTRELQSFFVESGYGRIINISSTSALGNRGQANYSAAKAGVQGITKTLALELGKYGITTNAVAPGFIATEMTNQTADRLGMTPSEFQEAIAKQNASARVGKPEDVAATIAFLASKEAGYINGQTIYIDGGGSL